MTEDLDGCELDFTESAVEDEEIPYLVLFAGVPENEIEAKAQEWKKVFSAEGS